MGWNLSNGQNAGISEVRYKSLTFRYWTSHLPSPGLSFHKMTRELNDLRVPFSSTNLSFCKNSLKYYPYKGKTSRFHPYLLIYQRLYKRKTLIHLPVLFILGNKTSLPENNGHSNELLHGRVS